MKLILASIFGAGVVVGACLASYAMQSNYREYIRFHTRIILSNTFISQHSCFVHNGPSTYIMSSEGVVDQIQVDYQANIQRVQHQMNELEQLKEDYNSDKYELGLGTPTRTCHPKQTPQKYIDEISNTYRRTTEALQKASHRVQAEIDKQESLQLQLSSCDKRNHAIRNSLTTSYHNIEGLQREVQSLTTRLQSFESELDTAFEELDRRDIERVECDTHYRNLVQCRGEEGG